MFFQLEFDRVINLWNALPDAVVGALDINSFNYHINK